MFLGFYFSIFRNKEVGNVFITYIVFFVGLLIYSVVVIPVFTVATSAFVSEGYVCDLLLDGKVSGRYILNYGLVFSTSIPSFRRSISCSMRPMTEKDRKEIE